MHIDSDLLKRLLVGNIEYVLLVISMLMTRMVWLRTLAVGSGVAGFIYCTWWLHDPVGMFWETTFTLVNVAQLALLKYRNVATRFSDNDREFYLRIFPQLEPYQMRRLLKAGLDGEGERSGQIAGFKGVRQHEKQFADLLANAGKVEPLQPILGF